MADSKFKSMIGVWLFLFGVALILIGVILFVISPYWGSHIETEVYIRMFLIISVVLVFGILRLYNSIVAHTRFTIRLRESVMKMYQSFPALERCLNALTSSANSLKGNTDDSNKELKNLLEALGDSTEKVSNLTKEIKNKNA